MKYRRALFSSLCVLVLSVFCFSPANAAIDAAGAEKLHVLLSTYLTEQKTLNQDKLIYDGEISVEPAGSYYAVTLPHMKMIAPGGTTIDYGIISLNAAPGVSEDQWKISIALATPIIISGEAGEVISRITITDQKAGGIFDSKLGNFTDYEARYASIKATGENEHDHFQADNIELKSKMRPGNDSLWSGDFTVSAGALHFKDMGDVSFMLENVEAASTASRIDMTAYQALRAQGGDAITPSLQLWQIFDDLSMKLSTGTLSSTKSPADDTKPIETFSVKNTFFEFGFSSLRSPKAGMNFGLGFEDLNTTSTNPALRSLAPEFGNFSLVLTDLPVQDLITLGNNTAAAQSNPDMAKIAGLTAIMQLPALLGKAGSGLVIEESAIGNMIYSILVTGRAAANPTAVTGATASGEVVYIGLDALMTEMQNLLNNPDVNESTKQNMRESLAFLGRIKPLATQVTRDGKPAHVFRLKHDETGNTTINEQNAQTFLSPPEPQDSTHTPEEQTP